MIHIWLQLGFYVPSIVGMILLIAFVFANNPRNLQSRVFSALSGVALFYIIFALVANLNPNPAHAIFWMRLADGFGSMIAGFLYWFIWIFPERRPIKLTNWLILPPAVFFLFAVWLQAYMKTVVLGPYGYIEKPGPLGWAFQIYVFGLATFATILLLRKMTRVPVSYRNQVRFMAYGVGSVLVLNLLFNFSGGPLHLDKFEVFFAVPSYLLLVGSIGYGMVKHNLFDVRPLAARSLAYTLLLVTLGGLYGTAIFGVSRLFFSSNQTTTPQQFIYTLLAILLAFTFQPLRRFFEKATDRIFFRDTYDTEDLLKQLGEIILSEIVLDKLLKKTLNQLCRRLRVASGHFLVLHLGHIYDLADYGHPLRSALTMEEVRALGAPVVVADQLDDSHKRQLLNQLGVRISVLLRTKDQFVGFLMLGDKLSGDIYTDQDIELLKILASQLAVAISNAISYEQVSRFNETLKDRVNRATARLRVANHHLKELDNAKDEFISMASHQLRTPLTTIKGYISMMLEGDAEPLQPKQRKFAEMAFESTQRMVYVIADLLNVSRLSAGRFIMDPEPTDMIQLVHDEVRLLETHAATKGLKLNVLTPKTMPKITIDAGKIRQVIINMVDNAIYYTKEGSVTVTLSHTHDAVRLSVTDTGIGVPDEAKSKLFTKFYRADNAQNVRPDGTGLGLYLAKKIIEAESGKLLFESTEGQGSMFGFELSSKAHHDAKPHQAKPLADTDKVPIDKVEATR